MADRLPDEQRKVASLMQLLDAERRSGADLTNQLETIAKRLSGAKAAVDLHLRGMVLQSLFHEADAAKSYQLALEQYKKDQAPVELQALCLADFGQLYLDLRDDKNYDVGLNKLQQSRTLTKSPIFTVACLCQEGDLFRRWGDAEKAQESLNEAERLLGGEEGQKFAGNHPLHAAVFERQSWVALDLWQMRRVIELARKAMDIRNANLEQQNPRSLRWIAINGLVPAMAEHFLGDTPAAIGRCRELLDRLDAGIEGRVFEKMTKQQCSELREVRCSVAEWLAAFYLLGNPPQENLAVETLRQAVFKAEEESLGQWQNVAILQYRLCMALAVSGQLSEAQRAFDEAEMLLKEKAADLKNHPSRKAAFAIAGEMAQAVLQLYATDPKTQQQSADALKQLLLRDTPGRIELRDREMLWFAAELLFQRGHLDKPSQAKVAHRLWILTEPPRKSPDREITRKYLQRYLRAAVAAMEKSGPADTTSQLPGELKQFQELVVP